MKTSRYTGTAILFHWLIAIGILGAFAVGVYMHELSLSPWKLKVYSWHKWAGVTIFLLAVLRLGWRAGHRPPELPAMPLWQQRVAALTHVGLYALMFAIPLAGWLMSSAKGFTTVYFGVLPLPDLLAKNVDLGKQLAEVHETLAWLMLGLVGLHAAGALKHHLLDKDDVLKRMLPRFGRS